MAHVNPQVREAHAVLALIFTTFMIQLVAHSLHYFRCAAHAWTTIVSIIWSVALELFALLCTSCLDVADAAYDDCPGKPNFCMVSLFAKCWPVCACQLRPKTEFAGGLSAAESRTVTLLYKCRLQFLLHRH